MRQGRCRCSEIESADDRAWVRRRFIYRWGRISETERRICTLRLPFYETEPVNLHEQPWFLNCAVEGVTEVPAAQLLKKLREIESRMGSKKLVAKAPRVIDLDILLYGQETIDTVELHVPHPRMHLRRFVLVPLAEIAPELRHPAWSGTAGDLLAKTLDASEVRKTAEV